MIKIANIITNCELINHKKLDYINYCDDPNNIIDGLPKLLVGWKFLNEKTGLRLSILDKEISNRFFWEFSPDEDIIQYTNGLESFLKSAPTLFINKFRYINADPFNYKIFNAESLEQKLLKIKNGKLYVYRNDMGYYWVENKIYGFKLSMYNAILGENVALELLKSVSDKFIADEGDLFQQHYKIFPNFPQLKRSIVVFSFS